MKAFGVPGCLDDEVVLSGMIMVAPRRRSVMSEKTGLGKAQGRSGSTSGDNSRPLSSLLSNSPEDPMSGPISDAAATKVQEHIGRQLKAAYDDVLKQPIPDRFLGLLDQLAAHDRD